MHTTKIVFFGFNCLLWISGTYSIASPQSPNDTGRNSSQTADATAKIMDDIFSNYDKRLRPNFGGDPVEITLTAWILDIYDINEVSHEFTANLYLRHKWNDPRLTFRPPAGVKYLALDTNDAKKLWVPDTFVVNERKASVHSFSVPNEFNRVEPDGTVLRSTRVTVTASCLMNLKWFPFDRHTCSINLESYGYKADDIAYVMNTDKIGVSEETQASIQFSIAGIKANVERVEFSPGIFSRASIDIFIKRNALRYIQDIFFPAIILPLVAFITLCTGTLQSRVHLSVLTMVAMVIFQTLTSTAMPKVSYQTALDFYVFNSSVMIFNVVITNFLIYHFMSPKNTSDDKVPLTHMNGNADDSVTDIPSDFKMGRPRLSNRFHELLFKMCEKNKFTMPLFFVLFNIIYWPIVLICSNTFPEDFILLEDHSV